MKYLRVTMPDGSRWDVPAGLIAANRAAYYADQGDNYEEEYDYTMSDDYQLTDWAANNMNWSDVQHVAVEVAREGDAVDYQEGWVNGEKEIVEHA